MDMFQNPIEENIETYNKARSLANKSLKFIDKTNRS